MSQLREDVPGGAYHTQEAYAETRMTLLHDLPARTELTLTVSPEAAEAAYYEALRREAASEIGSTLEKVPDFAALPLDNIRVKGKTRPVFIYTLLGDGTVANNQDFIKLKSSHDAMMGSYRKAQFAEAAQQRHRQRVRQPQGHRRQR